MYQIEYMKSVGKRIKDERENKIIYYEKKGTKRYKRMAQIDLAKKIDEFLKPEETKNDPEWDHKGKRVQVSNWEHGKGKLTLDDALAICEVLDIDINYLLGVRSEKKPLEELETRILELEKRRKEDKEERQKKAGLTYYSIDILERNPGLSEVINNLLESDAGIQMIETFYKWCKEKKEE